MSLRGMLNARSAEMIGEDRQKLGISLHNISQPRCISDVHIRHLSSCRAKMASKRREARRETRPTLRTCLNLYVSQLPTRRTRHSPLSRAKQEHSTDAEEIGTCSIEFRNTFGDQICCLQLCFTKRECAAAEEGRRRRRRRRPRRERE